MQCKRISDRRGFEHSDGGHAGRWHHDDLTKTVLAKLMAESDAKSAVEREQFARAHPKYEEHLKAKQEVGELDYIGRQRIAAANAVFECWRTMQANDRGLEKIR